MPGTLRGFQGDTARTADRDISVIRDSGYLRDSYDIRVIGEDTMKDKISDPTGPATCEDPPDPYKALEQYRGRFHHRWVERHKEMLWAAGQVYALRVEEKHGTYLLAAQPITDLHKNCLRLVVARPA